MARVHLYYIIKLCDVNTVILISAYCGSSFYMHAKGIILYALHTTPDAIEIEHRSPVGGTKFWSKGSVHVIPKVSCITAISRLHKARGSTSLRVPNSALLPLPTYMTMT